MNLAEVSVRRPVFATMLTVALVVLGAMSYRQLGVDLLPAVEEPTVTVFTTLDGASPEEIESAVTQPIEEQINTIAGIKEVRSVSREGRSMVFITFEVDRDPVEAVQDVRDKVSLVQRRLPEETDPPVIFTYDADAIPIRSVAISGPQSLRELTEFAETRVKDLLSTAPGVGQVDILGGRRRAVNIFLDAERLSAYGLTAEDVEAAIQASNVEIPGGRMTRGAREDLLRTLGRIERVRDFEEVVVATDKANGAPILLRDVATVEDGVEEPRGVSRLNGQEAVTLRIQKQSGANLVKTAAALDERIETLRPTLPPGAEILVLQDSAVFVDASTREAQTHLVLGGILAALAVLLFMGSLRATLIAAVAIPSSLIATFTAMNALGFTLNNITLLALTLAVGIVIDDAIVVIENIHRHMEERGIGALQAAIEGTKEISLAITATTLSLVVIFLPVAFLSGQVGRLFSSYGVTVAAAVVVSLFIAFTLTPMLGSRFLESAEQIRAKKRETPKGIRGLPDRLMGWADAHYMRLVHWSLGHRKVVAGIGLACVAATVPLFALVGKEFIPVDDQSEFEISIELPTGTSFEAANALVREIEGEVRKLPAVRDILASIGDTRGGGGAATRADIYVGLSPLDERDISQFEVMAAARKIFVRYPDLRVNIRDLAQTGFRNWGGKVKVVVRGPELEVLEEKLGELMAGMRQEPALVDVGSNALDSIPEVQVHLDRRKAADLGIRPRQVAEAMELLVGGRIVSAYREGDERYDVILRARLEDRDEMGSVARLPLRTASGALVPLENVATLEEGRGPTMINRQDGLRGMMINANPAPGVPLGEAIARVEALVAGLNLPPGYDAVFVGDAETMAETVGDFALALLLSLVFMYMVLASQFESFLHPVTILLALPLTAPFALLSLLLTDETLNVYSVFGVFLLFGIVKKNGILQVDYTNTLKARGMKTLDAIVEANRARLRPILMTTLTLIAGMTPMALGEGPGAASRASLARAVVGGQALSLVITLLIVPVAYATFDDLHQRWITRKGRKRPSAVPALPVEEERAAGS
jgi:HAE1 family hydrophobic/amphiphilic exporter-1